MLNYIKSEFYRVFSGKEIYTATGVLALLTVIMNLVLFVFSARTPDFPYGSVRFSLNTMIGTMNVLMFAGLLITSLLFSDEYKSGTLKNTVSFGITRSTFFTGKCIVCCVSAVASLAVVLTVYIGSAYLLLREEGNQPLVELLRGTASCLPAAFASVVLTAALYCLLQKEISVMIGWMIIFWGIPTVFSLLGLKIQLAAKIASWMPFEYLNTEITANMSVYDCLWDTPEGFMKCIVSGVIGILVFYGLGIFFFRKKEIV